MSEIVEITTTLPDRRLAETLARKCLDHRLVACIQISGPITSIYRWNNQVQADEEWKLTIKTHRSRSQEVRALILDDHPYDIPEILMIRVEHASEDYEAWVRSETT